MRGGAVVAFPTETVYGLGASAFNARAVAKVFDVKRRPSFDPLIVHVSDDSMLREIVASVPHTARRLIDAFWPGPLTLIFQKSGRIAEIVTAGLPSVAVRMPAHPVARTLIERSGVPIAAPSANPFGFLSPTRAEHVAEMFGASIDMIVDGGPTQHGIESTIVLLEPVPTLLRPGAIPVEDIEALVGPLSRERTDAARPLAPGRLPQHYAPRTPIHLVDCDVVLRERQGAALLAFRDEVAGYQAVRVLSRDGDLREAGSKLFQYLHELDALQLMRIDAQTVPEIGIGTAIMDRLRRAAHR
ncbi:MAG: L-threonylcarbamoyladenylate synthase [Candidatus Eremiobacteraeota bacterium]|nr:L-threonylcarbamoyladenylate synthase [Candidatus Eremiobacteraeota bacterium]